MTQHKYVSIQTQLNGSQIGNLALYGPYEVIVTSRGILELPSTSAQYNYIGIPILRGSDVRLILPPGAGVEFVIGNDTGNYPQSVKITRGEIQLNGISLQPSLPKIKDRPSNDSSILLKSPKIEVNGSTQTLNSFTTQIKPLTRCDRFKLMEI